jgi:energy-converting hydrogenase Eha subunit E
MESMMETSMMVNLLAVIVVATAVLIVLTLMNACVGAPPEAPALGALGFGLAAVGVALIDPRLSSTLAAPVVDVVANVVL